MKFSPQILSIAMQEKLKQVLSQEDTVLFIGSGISLWSGLPSWPRLIENLATFVEESGSNADLIRAEARRGDLLQAASYGFYKLTKSQIGEFIRKSCLYGKAKPHAIHQKIVTLGPRCFITTNYDNLIEESLRIWQSDRFFRPPVTNRHLTETAEIVHARAIDFVFKPHGDAADSDSIILTREQYRQLLPGGERHAALESVKMLLASRPVVYIGFGLRDPDFIYVRDLLSNTYKGGVRDHYAILADVSDAEIDYWRINYGIHIAGYSTTECADNSKDHSELLTLLDKLLAETPSLLIERPLATPSTTCAPDIILALARHAGRVTRTPKEEPEFPIRVHFEERGNQNGGHYYSPNKFNYWTIERFLDSGPARALLIGLPGAGKSYSFKRAAARLAETLHQACLSDTFDETAITIPLFVDLKLYRGDLHNLVEQTLPSGLLLDELVLRFKVKIFLDSFNEMPREYWESGSYEADFSHFNSNVGNASIIIGSRTNDGLTKMEFPSYSLDQIDEGFVKSELERLKINVGGRFEQEILSLLQKPFYFHLVTAQAVPLPKEPHPRDFYQTLFRDLTDSFEKRFGVHFNLMHALSIAAYEAINRGEEAQPLATVLQALKTQLQEDGVTAAEATDVANWLVSKSILIPYTGARAAFFHQSATEFLAACELARRYQATPQILNEKLTLTRWDQALFLTLSLLPQSASAAFLQSVIDTDFSLALNASKYLETERDEVIAKLLSEIPDRIQRRTGFDHEIEWLVESVLPISEAHEPQLRALMKCGNIIGGAAVIRLAKLKGAAIKDELLQLLFDSRNDYNYCCNGIAEALAPFATIEDIRKVAELADSIQHEVTPDSDDDVAHGFTSGAARFLAGLDISAIGKAFLPKDDSIQISEIRSRILCGILWKNHSSSALDLAGLLLLQGVKKAATAIFFVANFSDPDSKLSWDSFTRNHVQALLSQISSKDNESWAVSALACLCNARPDMADFVREFANKETGIKKAALLYCADPGALGPVFDALGKLAEMSAEERSQELTGILSQIELDWVGHEALLGRLLRLRDTELAVALIEAAHYGEKIGELDIGPIEWWLQWLMDENSVDQWFFMDRLSSLLAKHTNDQTHDAFVREFNNPTSKFRRVLSNIFLNRRDLSTDAFTEDAISFLMADLNHGEGFSDHQGHLLGNIATEQFVTERLLPLLSGAQPPLLENLRSVLKQAGSRHGRRYIAG